MEYKYILKYSKRMHKSGKKKQNRGDKKKMNKIMVDLNVT